MAGGLRINIRLMKKICICGSYGYGKQSLNGQTIKTEIVTEYYRKVYGSDSITTIDTQGLKNFLALPFKLFCAFFKCKNVIILPAHNSLRLLAPLCRMYQGLKGKKTHYIVIGGWLPHYLKQHPIVFWGIKSYIGIYVETITMKKALQELGLRNVYVMPNCKYLDIAPGDENLAAFPPLKLCTFSRINRMKGIEDAVNVVDEINKELGEIKIELDIYGRVDAGEQEWFERLNKKLPDGVRVKGAIPYSESVRTLREYHALLFPTRYFTEGIPGTIIDSYAAGLPVIASRWESSSDVVYDKRTGFIYDFENNKALKEILRNVLNNPQYLFDMRDECLRVAHDYLPENVMDKIRLK